MKFSLPIGVLWALLLLLPAAMAEERAAHAQSSEEVKREALPPFSTTHHSITVDGRVLHYTSDAGAIRLRGESGRATGEIFHVAHRLHPYDPARPVTFVFNGGPGAASAYLQLGAMGPRIVEVGAKGEILPPPPRLADNPDSWIDMTDLVFVDPIGTGYSRALVRESDEHFWGVEKDAEALAEFIRLYLTRQGRLGSPVFLVGESYGGFRTALLAKRLPARGIRPSGIVLISPALEFSLIFGDGYNPLSWALMLPSLAATNLEKQGVNGRETLAERLHEVEEYALSDYLVALAAGAEEGGKTASETVARFTGLPVDLVKRHNGRIPPSVFRREFRRAEGQVLSQYDGSIGAPDPDPSSSQRKHDAVLDRMTPAWTTAFVDYVQKELNYKTDEPYELLNRQVRAKWDFGTGPNRQGYAGVLEDLQEARSRNPEMPVLIAQGFTDLVTPYLAAAYLVKQLPPLADAEPIVLKNYAGGHMLYLRPESRAALKQDAKDLYERALKGRPQGEGEVHPTP